MTQTSELMTWERPLFEPGGGDAFVFYCVFGTFSQPLEISRSKYRTDGPPGDCQLISYNRDDHPEDFHHFIDEESFLGRICKEEHPETWTKIQNAKEVIMVQGEVPDPENLNYLRDAIGVVTALLDGGGLIVLDTQQIRWWEPDEWRQLMFTEDAPSPLEQVIILKTEDEKAPEKWWLHTRGMRKFGRPDLSVHDVDEVYEQLIADLIERFIGMQAQGVLVPEGKTINVKGLPKMTCHHRGDLDDIEFNNVHLEIEWP